MRVFTSDASTVTGQVVAHNSGARRTATRRSLTTALAGLFLAAGCDLVKPPEATSVTLAPQNFEITVNGSVRVVGTAFDKDGKSLQGKAIGYSSSDNSVATVTADGLVIGVAAGKAIIAGVANKARGETSVTVLPELPNNVLVTPSSVTLRRNNVRQFTATPRSATGTAIPGLTTIWASSNSSIASVSSTGEVIAIAPGNVTIVATVNTIQGSAQVTVTEVPIGAISLAPLNKTIQVNESFIPDITLRDSASNIISSQSRTLSWSSTNELNASVSGTGVVRGGRVGTARITASSPQNPAINGSMDVTVTERIVETVVISPRTGSLRLGVPRQMFAQLLDSLNQNVSGRVPVWTSLAPTVATVSANGTVTGLSLGTARIRASIDNAADTVTFQVTKIPVGEITLTPPQASVIQGSTTTLTAIVKDSLGTEVSDRTLLWLTSNQGTATVVDGVVTGVSAGTATITASAENRSGSATITVLQVPVDSLRLANPTDVAFSISAAAPNNNRQVQLEPLDANGAIVLNRNILITSSSPSVANGTWNQSTRILTVTATSATSSGTTTISMRALGANGNPEGKTTQIVVTVTAAP